MNWIDEFYDTISKYTDAPEPIIRGGGYWIISATLGKFFQIMESKRPLKPNVFVIFCGPAGISRKSTVISYSMYVYKRAWEKYIGSIGINIDVEDKFIEEFTIEGITDYIDEYINISRDFVLTTDEFGVWLQRSGSRYMVGTRGMLSKLYYGETYKQVLSKRSGSNNIRKVPGGLYFTMICGMQDADLYLDEMDVRQGLVRRTLFINVKPEDKTKYIPPLDENSIYIYAKLDKIGDEIGDKMIELHNLIKNTSKNRIEVYMYDTIREKINERAKKLHDICMNKYINMDGGYLDTCWEHLLKLTVLETIANPNLKPNMLVDTYAISVRDIDAFRKADEYMKWINNRVIDMIIDVNTPKDKVQIKDVGNIESKIQHILIRNNGYIGRRELAKKINIENEQLRDILCGMIDNEKLWCVREKIGRGRPQLVFFINENVRDRYCEGKDVVNIGGKLLRDIW